MPLEAEVQELRIWKRDSAAQVSQLQKWKTYFEASTKLTTDRFTNGINILRSKTDRW